MTIAIRPLTPADADPVARMNAEFVAYLREMGDPESLTPQFTKEKYLADGFGPNPAFSGYIAEEEGEARGYLLYFQGYNVDLAQRLFFICDLWVDPRMRRKGTARALMERCAADCRAWGGQWLEWYVYKDNSLAFDFYHRLGAHVSNGCAIMSVKSDAL